MEEKNDPAKGGGRIREDNKTALARNGKPSKAYRESLHTATQADMEKLVAAVLETLVNGEDRMLLKTSYIFKWPEGFPAGKVVQKEGLFNYRNVSARDLLVWLYDHGYTTMTAEKVRGIRQTTSRLINNT